MAPAPALTLASILALAGSMLPVHATEGMVTTAVLQQAAVSVDEVTRLPAFMHRMFRPEKPSDRTIIMLHGSGGDETTLASLASTIAPDATLIGVRGRVVQDGVKRWYKRISPTQFDQDDIRKEAAAFVEFLKEMAAKQKLDLSKVTFLGYTYGANLIAALTQLYLGLVLRDGQSRPMPSLIS